MANSDTRLHDISTAIADRLLRLREWLARRDDLAGMDRREMERIATDLNLTARQLETLVALGPEATDLLRHRMGALGVTRDDVERVARSLMRDLERTCAYCESKGTCATDLASRPDDPAWKGYCPNATELETVKEAKDRFA